MRARAALAIALAVLALTATASGSVRPETPGSPSHISSPPALVTDQTPVPAGHPAVPLPAETPIPLTLVLAFSHPGRLSSLLTNLTDPSSPEYRAFLSAAQFRAEFAPGASEIATARSALLAEGASSITVAPGRLAVLASVPAAGVAALFGVRLVSYSDGGARTAYTATGVAHLPASLSGIVTGVGGLSNARSATLSLAARESTPRPLGQYVVQKSTGVQWDVGSDFAAAFGATTLWPGVGSVANATFPTGVAVATLLASAYNASFSENLPPYDPQVVSAYFHDTLAPTWPTPAFVGVPVAVPGALTPPMPGSFDGLNDSTDNEIENSLDVEMAGSLAPGATIYTFYFAGSQTANPTVSASTLADDFGLDLAQALNYSYGPSAPLAEISGSFGLPEVTDPLWNSGLEEATALGVTVVCASGDQGDAPGSLTGRGGQWPYWPATAASDVAGAISVGGTNVTLAGAQTSNDTVATIRPAYDANITGISKVAAWYENTTSGKLAGSEGGASSIYPEPSWQFQSAAQPPIVNATERQGSSFAGRAGPDLALPANHTIAYVFASASGTIYLDILGGTSVAAPLLAGLLADVVAVESARAKKFAPLGFLDPELYRIASFFASPAVRGTALEARDPFLGVVRGHNFVFSAGPGWNAVTGWGEVSAPAFLAADVNATIADYVYTGPTPSLPHPPAPLLSAETEYFLIGVGALVAIALLIVAARPSRRAPVAPVRRPAPEDDLFGPPTRPTGSVGATFACPYCGGERPAEPVRCPHCGNL